MFFCRLAAMAVLIVLSSISIGVSNDRRTNEQPNILWITSEDNGPELGCYGDEYAVTPNIDGLAKKSLRYRRCWSNAPVCAPARTTLISGMYATSIGGHHMRSGISLPNNIQLYPEVLRSAGYYCTNNSKTDYNLAGKNGGWNESSRTAHWRKRPDKKTPFFAVFNFTISHESKIRTRPHQLKHDPADAPLPAYHPDTPEVRHDWAQYYDRLTEMDQSVGRVLAELENDGLTDSTVIFYYGDHGSGMPRSKRWPFDSGLRVPLLLHVPDQFRSLAPDDYVIGGESTRLVSFVDLAPTAISLAGVAPPENMQGSAFAGKFPAKAKPFIFGFRGRMDERIDMVRSCTDGRYVYMRHFYPDRPYLKHVDYMFQTPTTRVWKELFDAGKLTPAQAKFWQAKPVEELFDLHNDPSEVVNLAQRPEHSERVRRMRDAVQGWMIDTLDLGLLPEAEMHRSADKMSPRQYALEHQQLLERLASLSFDALDPRSGVTQARLAELSADPEAGIRFWAVRGLATRPFDATAEQALQAASQDASPSVAIAACDGLLRSTSISVQQNAVKRLIDLANVENVGHFAAIAAMNILDMKGDLDSAQVSRLKKLPRQLKQPPPRVGKYVGKLIDHATRD